MMLCEASCTIEKMRIEKCIRGTVYFVAFVVLLLTTVAESKWDEDELLLSSLVYSGDINLETAELLGLNCKVELLNAKKILQELNLHLLDETSSENESSQRKRHEVVTALRLQVKQLLLDCLSEKRSIYGEDKSSDTWYNRYLGYYHHSSERRMLAQAPDGSPAASPSVSPPSPAPLTPSASPPQSSLGLPFNPSLTIPGVNLQPPPNGVGRSSNVRSNRQETTRRTVIIAVVVTAVVTFAVAAFFFFCWRRCRGYRHHGNDGRPLLSLSLNDYSFASDHKMFGLGATTVNDGNVASQSTNSKLSNHDTNSGNYSMGSHSQSNSKSEIQVVKTASNSLENFSALPPGIPSAHGMAPLKPPPGKTNSLEAIPAKTVPPPPPPAPKAPPPPPEPPHPPPPGPPPPPPMAVGPRPPPPPMMSGPRPPPPPMMSGPRPPPPPMTAGSRPPPPPMKGGPPRPPPGVGGPPRPPPGGLKPHRPGVPSHPSTSFEAGEAKTKLKPFFWDKVLANPDESMVWNQIKSGSFQFNEEMIETLFGVAPAVKNQNDTKKDSSHDPPPQFIKLIDPKKAQNLSILLRALNVTTEEVCDALEEGNELPAELIQTFLKMAPTTEEELKLRLYDGELSLLGPAERFLKVLVNIPFAFKRLESLHFMCILQEEQTMLKESFAVLEAACTELRKSRLFLKLLEAVLKTGNRMNDGTFRGGAQAFKLDTLLKLSDVKGTDGKTTLLHFVVQEITISEGVRAARAAKQSQSMSSIKSDDLNDDSTPDTSDENLRAMGLQVISGVGDELVNVRKAAVLDSDMLTGTVARLGHALIKARDFLNSDMKHVEEDKGFCQVLKSFVQNAEVDVMSLLEEEKRIMLLVKSTGDYFHGHARKDEGLKLFVIVRDFLIILEKVCREVKNAPRKPKVQKKEDPVATPSDSNRGSRIDPREKLFPAIADRRVDSSSSDDES